MSELEIEAQQLEAVWRHASDAMPHECCGLLLGARVGSRVVVDRIVAVDNTAPDPSLRYEMAPEDLLVEHRRARRAGLDVVGYYHSHPLDRPVPSARDLAAAWPGASYLIVSMAADGLEARSWRLSETGVFEEEAVVTARPESAR